MNTFVTWIPKKVVVAEKLYPRKSHGRTLACEVLAFIGAATNAAAPVYAAQAERLEPRVQVGEAATDAAPTAYAALMRPLQKCGM